MKKSCIASGPGGIRLVVNDNVAVGNRVSPLLLLKYTQEDFQNEQPHEKTNKLHMRKQRCRSASR